MANAKSKIAAAFAAAVLVGAPAVLSSNASAAPAATSRGCPSGWVCIYGQNSGSGGPPGSSSVPIAKFYSYGAHNLSNMYGYHWIFNNQTGDAIYYRCGGYNGTGKYQMDPFGGGAGGLNNSNLTPTNSIVLASSESKYPHSSNC